MQEEDGLDEMQEEEKEEMEMEEEEDGLDDPCLNQSVGESFDPLLPDFILLGNLTKRREFVAEAELKLSERDNYKLV